ncbi:RNA-directed DNA polymerase from mobile element jockey [Araneus ventricosus]|uniref:RNA-directed DNA polymerase from mobile element jockey n=1 Tax=Araneus ventricosus TaxID=182803 RepID=A0A4Y2FWY7_ARAVE|nr:RNA-directed DNA polymerase from mobile element jockey [Araneus ventricosus]
MCFGYFPTRWKTATVIPILKPGKDPTVPDSYRPISLLPTFSKIAEHCILIRLNEHLEVNNVLIPEQFGFRKNLSTTHQLLRVTEYIAEGFSNKQKTGAVFLDIQKAFDRVWQDALIYKLINYNTPNYLIKIFTSYLHNRKFAVRVNKELSNFKNINAGVAQGSKCGPILFALFINDIPKQFNTMLSIFADDTAILARNKNHNYIRIALNRHLKTLEEWFLKWKIQINAIAHHPFHAASPHPPPRTSQSETSVTCSLHTLPFLLATLPLDEDFTLLSTHGLSLPTAEQETLQFTAFIDSQAFTYAVITGGRPRRGRVLPATKLRGERGDFWKSSSEEDRDERGLDFLGGNKIDLGHGDLKSGRGKTNFILLGHS